MFGGFAEEDPAELRERIRERLPIETDGSVKLVAWVWDVRGGVPSHG